MEAEIIIESESIPPDLLEYFEPVDINKGSVWDVPTAGFSGAHFATFPQDLPVTPIKAGCPEFICSKCGKARETIWITTRAVGDSNRRGTMNHDNMGQTGLPQDCIAEKENRGLSDCNCGAPFTPGVVFDPFMGSGTVALVAKRLRRRYIGIELQPKYIQMAARRLAQEMLI